ncbi:MAG: GNAT family N-acetyltransferase [Acidobacteriota bacterium]
MTSTIRVARYDASHKSVWDDFIGKSKNGLFLFYRDYMEYHAARFPDHSLMFFKSDDTLSAVMPASSTGAIVSSHGGLTFGGIVTDTKMKTAHMLEIFAAAKAHLKSEGVERMIYKAVPHIYHLIPAEEDLYALFRYNAKLIRRDVSSTIDLKEKLTFSKGRKYEIKQAQKCGLEVKQSTDYPSFMAIEEHVLASRYDLKPVHTAEEMQLLAGRFPDNIKLFVASRDDVALAGVVIYESRNVAHAQYIAANDEGKKSGALDLVLSYLINEYYSAKKYFDFGISTENGGKDLNVGLIENKQSFGARAVVYDFYQLDFD